MTVLSEQEIVGVAFAEVRHGLQAPFFIDVEKMVSESLYHVLDVATNRIVEDFDEDCWLIASQSLKTG